MLYIIALPQAVSQAENRLPVQSSPEKPRKRGFWFPFRALGCLTACGFCTTIAAKGGDCQANSGVKLYPAPRMRSSQLLNAVNVDSILCQEVRNPASTPALAEMASKARLRFRMATRRFRITLEEQLGWVPGRPASSNSETGTEP